MSRIGNLTVRDRLRSAVLTVSGESKANSGIGLKAIADFFMSKYEMASRGSEVEHHPVSGPKVLVGGPWQ